MPRVKKLWKHKSLGKGYTGFYGTFGKDRVFILTKDKRKPKKYLSFQAAEEAGWRQ